MSAKCSALLVVLFVSWHGLTQQIMLEGLYRGTNIYVQNPLTENAGFCITKLLVNGKEIEFENSSAIEIKLSDCDLKIGDTVEVIIQHHALCKPQIINNAQNIDLPKTEITSVTISDKGLLSWTTINETNNLPYSVEQFRWNKWISVGEVEANGNPSEQQYTFLTISHSGENKFRLKQPLNSTQFTLSETVSYISDKPVVTFELDHEKKRVVFSDYTLFELYDPAGNLLYRNYGKEINCEKYKGRSFFMNYDNNNCKLVFRKR